MKWIFCLLVLLLGCQKSSTGESPQLKGQMTHFPELPKLSTLDAVKQSILIKLFNDEICPCTACQESFAACLSQCKSALLLAQWTVEAVQANVPIEFVLVAVSQEINTGFGSAPQIIDIEGYHSQGPTNAPYTIVEFADFECAHCKLTAKAMDEFLKKHPQEVRLVYKHFPLAAHPMAKEAALAAEAAGEQGQFWPMQHALFEENQLSSEKIIKMAEKLGLNIKKLKTDMKSAKIIAKVDNSIKEGNILGIEGTPAIFFNGRPFRLSANLPGLEGRLDMEKARGNSSCR